MVETNIVSTIGDPLQPGFTFQFTVAALGCVGFTFVDSGQALGVNISAGVALGDVDGDNDLDAVFSTIDVGGRVFMNDSLGVYTDSGQMLGGTPFDFSYDVGLGDVDGDGDLDAVLANGSTFSLAITNRLYVNDG